MALTNAQLAQQISEMVNYWRTRDLQFAAWLGGVADGGPYGDGRYPLTDYLGVTQYLYCPAALEAGVTNSASAAAAQAALAGASKDAALAAQAATEAARNLALTYRNEAQAARDLALTYRDEAANHKAIALTHRNNAAASATAAAESATDADTSADAAASSAGDAASSASAAAASAAAAAASAAAAATFNPADFYTKVASDARYLQLAGGSLTGLLTSTGDIRTSQSFRATGWNHSGASGPGAELGVSGGVAYLQSYNRTTLTFGVLNLQGSSVNLLSATGSSVLAATDSSVVISKFVEINTGTSMPLRLRVANSSPWALDLYRGDQAWSSKVFLHNSYGLGWHFEHTPSVAGLGPLLVMRNNAWLASADGYNRFYFANAGRTYFGSQDGYEWRDASNNTALMIEPGTNYLVPSSWIRLPINAGLYTSLDDTWYPDGSNYWIVKSPHGIRVRDRAGTDQGFLYHTGGGSFGLLDSGGNWRVRVNTGGVTLLGNTFVDNGIYWDQDTGFYIYNTSGYTHGSWRIGGARSGYVGLVLDDGGKRPTFMSNNTTAGIYEQGISAWHYYCQSGLFRVGSSYKPYFDGGPGAILHHTGSQTSGRITLSTSAASGTPNNGDIWIQHAA